LFAVLIALFTKLNAQEPVFTNYTPVSNNIHAIAAEADTIWIATDKGGVDKRLKSGSLLKRYSVADGLANNSVFSILIDSHGKKWFGNHRGISVF
jgi:ligand-binding sensor domain-containing protein